RSASRTAGSARLTALAAQFENRVASLTLAGIMLLPLAEIASRRFLHAAIPGSAAIVSALTLWLGVFGAAVAARDGKLLTLATGEFLPKGRVGAAARVLAGTVAALIATVLCLASVTLVGSDRTAGTMLSAAIPVWVADLALPIGFALIAVRLAWRASPTWPGRVIALLGIAAGIAINQAHASLAGYPLSPWLILLLLAGIAGAPIFSLLAGIALFASLTLGNPPVVLP